MLAWLVSAWCSGGVAVDASLGRDLWGLAPVILGASGAMEGEKRGTVTCIARSVTQPFWSGCSFYQLEVWGQTSVSYKL